MHHFSPNRPSSDLVAKPQFFPHPCKVIGAHRIGGARFCRAISDIFEPVGYLYPPRLCTGQNAWRLVAEGWDRLIGRFRIFTGQHIVNDALHFMRWNIQRLVLWRAGGSEEHTSELQSLMRISYAVFCLKKKKKNNTNNRTNNQITARYEYKYNNIT